MQPGRSADARAPAAEMRGVLAMALRLCTLPCQFAGACEVTPCLLPTRKRQQLSISS